MKSALAKQANVGNSVADRRRHGRYRYAAPISVHTGDGVIVPAITLEISQSGLSAMVSSPLKVGDTVRLDPVGGGTVTARVRHNVGKIYGFEFSQITEEQVQKLRDTCRRLPLYPPNRMGI
jgi:hypothetical protein